MEEGEKNQQAEFERIARARPGFSENILKRDWACRVMFWQKPGVLEDREESVPSRIRKGRKNQERTRADLTEMRL